MQPLEAAVFATIYSSLNPNPERAFPDRFQWCMCFPFAKMNIVQLLLIVLLVISCKGKGDIKMEHQHNAHVEFRLVSSLSEEELNRIFWQRSYPDEYAKAIEYAEASRQGTGGDPFAAPITVPDSKLGPPTLISREPIIPRIFNQLGWPLETNLQSSYNAREGTIIVTHDPRAIEAFLIKFPEFTVEAK